MKICVISYDFWNYDRKIVDALLRKGIEATHIRMTAYRYPNFAARVKNALSKVFLGKNLKKIHRQEMIMSELQNIGMQDQILVISPETIDAAYHEKIKKFTGKYIAYLYDSLSRNPAEHVLKYFDEVFTFDKEDAKRLGYQELHNYNYLTENQNHQITTDLIYVGSFDDRITHLESLAVEMEERKKSYRFIIIGSKSWKSKSSFPSGFELRSEKIPLDRLPEYYGSARAIVDLVRSGQNGLSFRFFEAMALRRKVITNNRSVANYDFYNPHNIFILDRDASQIPADFFETPYAELPQDIYQKYTVDYWVEKVFSLA